MAPQKKSKKDANSINAKLALVMKSGRFVPAAANLGFTMITMLTITVSLLATRALSRSVIPDYDDSGFRCVPFAAALGK